LFFNLYFSCIIIDINFSNFDFRVFTVFYYQIFFQFAADHDHSHFNPRNQSVLRTLILVGALSLHAIFEGLFFGVSKEQTSGLWGTLVAVLIHKSVIDAVFSRVGTFVQNLALKLFF